MQSIINVSEETPEYFLSGCEPSDRVRVLSACGDFIYWNSPRVKVRLCSAGHVFLFTHFCCVVRFGIRFLCGWNLLHTSHKRYSTGFLRNSCLLKRSWEKNNSESRSVKIMRSAGPCALKVQSHVCSLFGGF